MGGIPVQGEAGWGRRRESPLMARCDDTNAADWVGRSSVAHAERRPICRRVSSVKDVNIHRKVLFGKETCVEDKKNCVHVVTSDERSAGTSGELRYIAGSPR